MLIDGKLVMKLDDEQLDQIAVEHCRTAIQMIKDVVEIDRLRIDNSVSEKHRSVIQEGIDENLNYAKALNTVIEYFGGCVIPLE